jgi:peptide/nickel transport system permease protein
MTEHSQAVRIAGMVGRGILTLLISGLLGAALVRMAPGGDVDEQELDPRLRRESIEILRRQRAAERNSLNFYPRFIAGLLRGDAGHSTLFGAPVAQLIRERIGTTARSVFAGLIIGWCAAILLAIVSALHGRVATVLLSTFVSATLLSVPSAVLAVMCLLLDLPPAAALAAVVFPRVYPHAYAQLRASLETPHVIMARARGLSRQRVFCWHVIPTVLGPMLALAGVSVALAFGASIPVEALADSPGVGQLAWRAALGRDIQLLVSITLLLTAVTTAANLLSDIAMLRAGVRVA